jgi:hypothetical protein
MLWRKQITLLSPQSWEDRNDAYYLERYQSKRKLAAVLALCFSTKTETFHHWRVFSHGSSGVCVEFGAREFLTAVQGKPGFRCGFVDYCRIDKLEKNPPDVEKWPFLKRLPFVDEAEFRVIYERAELGELSKSIDFNLASIKRVTLSPWMPKSVAESVEALIGSIPGCSEIYVHRSSLIENGRWRNAIKEQISQGADAPQRAVESPKASGRKR